METKNINHILLILFLIFGASQGIFILPGYSAEREVDLIWRPVERAVNYQVQIATSSEMDPVSFDETVPKTAVRVQLEPGVYYYRIRGVIDNGIPGPWGDPEAFVVNQKPPRPISPNHKLVVKDLLSENGLQFTWSKGIPGSKYSIEISDEQGVILRRGIFKPEFHWKPEAVGTFKWRVGFETPYRTEWGNTRTFMIEKTAFPPAAEPATIVKEVIKTVVKTETVIKEKKVVQIRLIEDLGDPKERPSEWWATFWAQSNLLSYSQDVPGSLSSGSGTSQNLGGAFQFAYRSARTPESKWTHYESFRVDLAPMSTFNEVSNFSSGYAEFRLVREGERWKWGPILQASLRNLPLNVLTLGNTGIVKNSLGFWGYGGGLFISYRQSKRFLGNLFGVARQTKSVSTNAFEATTSLGTDIGVSATLFIGTRVTIEPRIRIWSDRFKWSNGGQDATQSLQGTQFEIGIGKAF